MESCYFILPISRGQRLYEKNTGVTKCELISNQMSWTTTTNDETSFVSAAVVADPGACFLRRGTGQAGFGSSCLPGFYFSPLSSGWRTTHSNITWNTIWAERNSDTQKHRWCLEWKQLRRYYESRTSWLPKSIILQWYKIHKNYAHIDKNMIKKLTAFPKAIQMPLVRLKSL